MPSPLAEPRFSSLLLGAAVLGLVGVMAALVLVGFFALPKLDVAQLRREELFSAELWLRTSVLEGDSSEEAWEAAIFLASSFIFFTHADRHSSAFLRTCSGHSYETRRDY